MYLSVIVPEEQKNSEKVSKKVNLCLEALKKQYPLSTPEPFLFKHDADYICITSPEFPLRSKLDSISSNRYY